MCPYCLGTIALLFGGTASSGGLAALAWKVAHMGGDTVEMAAKQEDGIDHKESAKPESLKNNEVRN